MPTAILFPDGSEFFDVEGVPVVLTRPPGKIPVAMAHDPGKPPRPFPFGSVMRNGSPVDEARFRAIADLPANLPRPRNLREGPKDPPLQDPAVVNHMLANLNSLGCNDGIPMLLDDDPVYWDDVGAEAADAMAGAAIRHAARR